MTSVFGDYGITRAQARAQALALLPAGYTSGRLAGDILPAPVVFTRSQAAGALATAVGPDGVTVVQYAANQPRFSGPLGRLVQEPQGTNAHTNPLGVGGTPGVIGSGGVMPSPWGAPSAAAGVTVTYHGTGATGGVAWHEFSFVGTTTSTWFLIFVLQGNDAIQAVAGQSFAVSAFAQITEGAWPSGQMVLGMGQHAANGTFLGALTGSNFLASAGSWLRRAEIFVANQPTVTNVRPTLQSVSPVPANTQVNFRIRLGGLDTKVGALVSSPTFPAAGQFGPVTRGDDIITAPLSALRIPSTGECSFLYRGLITGLTGQPQTILGLDDGTANNRFALRVSATGIPQVVRATGGTEVIADIGVSALTLGVPFSCGVCIDGAGRAFAVFQGVNGGAGVAVTGGPTSGLINARIGSSIVAANTMFGAHECWEFGRLASDAAMQARVAAY